MHEANIDSVECKNDFPIIGTPLTKNLQGYLGRSIQIPKRVQGISLRYKQSHSPWLHYIVALLPELRCND